MVRLAHPEGAGQPIVAVGVLVAAPRDLRAHTRTAGPADRCGARVAVIARGGYRRRHGLALVGLRSRGDAGLDRAVQVGPLDAEDGRAGLAARPDALVIGGAPVTVGIAGQTVRRREVRTAVDGQITGVQGQVAQNDMT